MPTHGSTKFDRCIKKTFEIQCVPTSGKIPRLPMFVECFTKSYCENSVVPRSERIFIIFAVEWGERTIESLRRQHSNCLGWDPWRRSGGWLSKTFRAWSRTRLFRSHKRRGCRRKFCRTYPVPHRQTKLVRNRITRKFSMEVRGLFHASMTLLPIQPQYSQCWRRTSSLSFVFSVSRIVS